MKRKINDPIFGLIELNEIESRIIDTPIFQRLRYIKQLALAKFVYPSACHDRFSHSLGVFYLSNKICEILNKNSKNIFSGEDIRNLRMAALLHDIGHYPYSHTLEYSNKVENFPLENLPFLFKMNHEEFGTSIIKKSYLCQMLEDNGYNINLICSLIEGRKTDNLLLSKIIKWELDADRLDYIIRDSFFTGVGFGNVNYSYLINSFRIYKNELIIIDNKAIRDIEHFIISRFSLHDRVYTHKRISYFAFMMSLAAYNLILNKSYPSFGEEKDFYAIIKSNTASMQLYELTDEILSTNLYKKLIMYRDDIEYDLIPLNKIIESVLFRKKFFKIFKFIKYSPNSEIKTNELLENIKNLLSQFIEDYPFQIFIHSPRNMFTKYLKSNYKFDDITMIEDSENNETEQAIWIQEKKKEPIIFYKSDQTFMEKIYNFGIIKVFIYIYKFNQKLNNDFKKLIPHIKDLVDRS